MKTTCPEHPKRVIRDFFYPENSPDAGAQVEWYWEQAWRAECPLSWEVSMPPKVKALIMESRDMDRALTRIAHEILERNKGIQDLVLIGIKSLGEILAQRLAAKIKNIEGTEVPFGAMDI